MLLIFDWDGTLSDSTGTITRAMQHAAADLGWTIPRDHEVHDIIGLGLPEALLRLFPEATAAEHISLREAYRANHIALEANSPSGFFPTVQETIERLRDDKHHLAIATSKSRSGLERILGGLGLEQFFHATRCADETASKPHPLMLEQLLTHFSVPAAEAVMIGDTEYDMSMAQQISMPRIAVSYGAHAVERLKPYGPELCLDRFDELLAWSRLV